jgi:hypothetical protein
MGPNLANHRAMHAEPDHNLLIRDLFTALNKKNYHLGSRAEFIYLFPTSVILVFTIEWRDSEIFEMDQTEQNACKYL